MKEAELDIDILLTGKIKPVARRNSI